MTRFNLPKVTHPAILMLVCLTLLSTTLAAQETVKIEGLIKGRSGDNMIVQTTDNPDLVVELTDGTDVAQLQGMFKARNKKMSMAALIPGLAVKVEGYYHETRLIARTVRFKGDDLKQAAAIQAGMHETQQQAQQNTAELEKHNAELKAQNEALQQHQEAIAANKAAVDAAVARFGQLDDYYIMDEVTVYFDNGKTAVDPKYNSQLLALTEKAKTVNGYMIEVRGYASVTGSAAMNQKLSEDRANNVTNILIQQGKVPLTRMLAPGAMGESEQVGNAKSTEGQAENRRVVVRVLQNKAIAGA
ncbi:OmpA family protein [Alloacidobacterium sp.]|uniref:OmpA family protein n=1 Tax=Alloacidobacterium sp. TaxID=2951999 RepID=UPI002D736361|nr:OmpA family protein [Alloacidobacterium sp.]HYK34723.1 OmpA family protein [Alloacidobacterium sp.]